MVAKRSRPPTERPGVPPAALTAFRHFSETRNVGDTHAGPYRYFDFGKPVLQTADTGWTEAGTVIYGGGLVWRMIQYHAKRGVLNGGCLVAWGIGLRGDLSARAVTEAHPDSPWRHVPRPSCMHPFFDAVPEPTEEVVLFRHARKSEGLLCPDGIPTQQNQGGTLRAALRFLASGATVVTNSYHGTYWALLMGRRVLCVPFSDKFARFARMPGLAGPTDWPEHLSRALSVEGWLEEARAQNRAYYRDVLDRQAR